MEEQKRIDNMGGTMRLGEYKCKISKGTLAHKAYKTSLIKERHRHRYEFNNRYMEMFEQAGMIFSGINPERSLVEIVELKNHPWFLATQFHPEFKSRLIGSHPLFDGFINAAMRKKK
jgi:CTP synthase